MIQPERMIMIALMPTVGSGGHSPDPHRKG